MFKTNHIVKHIPLKALLHLGFWSLVFLWPFLSTEETSHIQHIIYRNWLSTACLFIIFYINYFVLVDHLFFNNKKLLYYLFNLLLIIGFLLLTKYFLEYKIFHPSINGVRVREIRSESISSVQLILSMILSIGMCIGLKFNKKWIQNELLLQKVKETQLNSEIKYLKFQIQPHFLFNTLNNIYSLIDHSPDIAKNSVHSLSKMMRYLLHDAPSTKIPLTQEIQFLERFIALMQLRVSTNLIIEKNLPLINQPILISPLLLITFIENAFKHGIDAIQPSHIKINLTIENNTINYIVINSLFSEKKKTTDSGIGLENLKKRLELLYPKRFEMSNEVQGNIFKSKLILNYKE